MFEAIHGSAPRRAGQNLANPSGLLMGAVLMLVHIDLPEVAARVHNGWLRTLEDGVHTYDIYTAGISRHKVGTREFADGLIARLGKLPETLKAVSYKHKSPETASVAQAQQGRLKTELVGVDLFLEWPSRDPESLAGAVSKVDGNGLTLSVISNRGQKVWPGGHPETFCTDSFRCRFQAKQPGSPVTQRNIITLLEHMAAAGFDVVKTESLRNFDGKPGYTLSQGE
jgi:isocitrate dehydrogenase